MTRPLKIEGGFIAQFEDGDILTMTGLLNLAAGADIASASTVDLTSATGNCPKITGTTDIEAWTMNTGQQMKCIAGGAFKLVYDATTNNVEGGADYICAAGDIINLVKGLDGVVRVRIEKQDGTPVVGGTQIQPITASVDSNALTITLNPTTLDFRDSTLTSGAVNTRVIPSAISVVVSSGSTLGTVSGVPSRLAVLAIDNAGTVELAVVNMAGGINLDETGVISTTAEGGAGAADSATVIYSTTARTNVPYRVVGFVESTQATAGTWATAPSKIQGYGGQAFAAMSSLGYGQTWQNVTASRAESTTYYNTTGKPIMVSILYSNSANGIATLTVDGINVSRFGLGATAAAPTVVAIVPPGSSYTSTSTTGTIEVWLELR